MYERVKYTCKECKGNSLCEHNVMKYTCKERKSSYFCDHGKEKGFCNGCGGHKLCETHIVLRKKIPNMMDTVGIALPICFRVRLLHGTI